MNSCFQIQQLVVCCTPSEAEDPMHWTLPNDCFCHYFTVQKRTLWWQWLFFSKKYGDDIFRRCSWTGQLMTGEISWIFMSPMVSVPALTPQHSLPSTRMGIGTYHFCHMWFPFMSYLLIRPCPTCECCPFHTQLNLFIGIYLYVATSAFLQIKIIIS